MEVEEGGGAGKLNAYTMLCRSIDVEHMDMCVVSGSTARKIVYSINILGIRPFLRRIDVRIYHKKMSSLLAKFFFHCNNIEAEELM